MGSGNVEKRRRRIVGILGGPTGSGKTSVGILVAKRLGLEILSADSGQSRQGMEIGTAAPSASETAMVPHHLVACLGPTEPDTVVGFLGRTEQILETPGPDLLVVGGTGQYLSALLGGLDPIPAPDPVLKARLQDRWEREGREPLWKELLELNPAPPHDAWQNPVRLLRALEKAILLSQGAVCRSYPPLAPIARVFALELPREILHQRLETRLDAMLDAGWREEVLRLDSLPGDAPCWKCIGFPELREVVKSQHVPVRTRERILEATRQYAKRQETWLRNKLKPTWIKADRSAHETAQEIVEALGGAP